MQQKRLHRQDLMNSNFMSELLLLGGGTFILLSLVLILLAAIARG
jgi:hypothetical protein